MSAGSSTGISPARRCAFTVVRRVFEQGAFADRALHSAAAGLEPRDRALATALVYGTVQRRLTLDHVLAALSARPLARLDPHVVAALRLGLFQLLFLDGVAEHAAVAESVELVKTTGRGGAPLVNAVLRRATREAREIVERLDDETPERAAILHSIPPWLAEMWWRELGPEQARELMRSVNHPAEAALRVNTLVAGVADVRDGLPVSASAAPDLPEGLVLGAAFDVHGSELFAAGAVIPQSRASMHVGRTVAPVAGERVLDLCAAPGGKTTHLAALAADGAQVVAVERHVGRAAALQRTCRRMRAGRVRVEVGDAAEWASEERYDRVLVDPPCSGLGTLQSRPDRRWRATPESIPELGDLQSRILARGARATASGGVLVYSVCTISRAEGPDLIDAFVADNRDFEVVDVAAQHPEWAVPGARGYVQLLPHRDGTDGFFIAKLQRR